MKKVGMTAYDVIKSVELIDTIKSLADRIKDSLESADAEKANTYAYALAEAAEELRKRTQADYYAEIDKNWNCNLRRTNESRRNV